MRVLVTNDDGPPNQQYSPYIRPFVQQLQRERPGWQLTVVVPHVQRSWIGKAHLAGQELAARFGYTELGTHEDTLDGPYARPQVAHGPDSKLQAVAERSGPERSGPERSGPERSGPERSGHALTEWILIDGTPASCVNIGLHLLSHEPFDLVISGPNVGRNTSAAYITSSGTVGAAMEAVIAGDTRAIALSWAYYDGHSVVPESLRSRAAAKSLQIIEHLYHHWDPKTDLYSVNVPLHESLGDSTPVCYAPIWENRWTNIYRGPVFQMDQDSEVETAVPSNVVSFHWAPNFSTTRDSAHYNTGIHRPTDRDLIDQHKISVTPLRATFQTLDHLFGEIQLGSAEPRIFGMISTDEYIQDSIADSLKSQLPNLTMVTDISQVDLTRDKLIHYAEYEDIDHELLTREPNYIANTYIYRKALIRKHYLAHTANLYKAKHPDSILHRALLETHTLELDYAEFLDDALDEQWELRQDLEQAREKGTWWILKPSMSDKAQGIRVFQTVEQLQEIFNDFEEDEDEDDDNVSIHQVGTSSVTLDDRMLEQDNKQNDPEVDTGIRTSQLRHFVIQQYLTNPLLLDSRKFHLRCYIVCKGNLEVYVYDRMLALFAATKFEPLTESHSPTNMRALECHLTNTCVQGGHGDVAEFDKLVSREHRTTVLEQVHAIAHDIFLAAAGENAVHFQPLSNAFETYGVDFLVDDNWQVSLLEVNAGPDFKQTGNELKGLIDELLQSIAIQCIAPLLSISSSPTPISTANFTRVLAHTSNGWAT